MSYRVLVKRFQLDEWDALVSLVLPKVTEIRLHFGGVDQKNDAAPGHPAFMALTFMGNADVDCVRDSDATASCRIDMTSPAGRDALQLVRESPPGEGRPLFSYDLAANDRVILAVRDLTIVYLASDLVVPQSILDDHQVDTVSRIDKVVN